LGGREFKANVQTRKNPSILKFNISGSEKSAWCGAVEIQGEGRGPMWRGAPGGTER